jgi:hypothetical protein
MHLYIAGRDGAKEESMARLAAVLITIVTVLVPHAEVSHAAGAAPHMQYRVLLAGTLDEQATAIAVDHTGDAYVAGGTDSSDFPTLGAAQSRLAGGADAWVAKLDPSGHTLWSTYFGGSRNDYATGIALDPQGNAWVTGWTESSDLPVAADALQHTFGGGVCAAGGGSLPCEDAFIAEYSPNGALLYSTYLGGKRYDVPYGIATDAQGRIGIAGVTQSGNFPVHNALQSKIHSTHNYQICPPASVPSTPCPDGFVTVLASAGRGLVYSTFLGGNQRDAASGIAFDAQGDAFVAGWTESKNFPVAHPLQRHLASACRAFRIGPNCEDAFVAELNPSGSRLLYSTYVGGNAIDAATGIAVDSHGAAYITGFTDSTNFPRRRPVEPPHPKGGCTYVALHTSCPDMFVSKFAPGGAHLTYSSHFGGDSLDEAQAVAVDSTGAAYVVGHAGSYNFPLIHPLQKKSAGGFDAAIVTLTGGGNKARFSTYFGGQGDDYANAVAVGPPGTMYVVGELDSTKYTGSTKSFRGQDAFVLKITIGGLKARAFACVPRYLSHGAGCPKHR